MSRCVVVAEAIRRICVDSINSLSPGGFVVKFQTRFGVDIVGVQIVLSVQFVALYETYKPKPKY